jgi:hypothetical protein
VAFDSLTAAQGLREPKVRRVADEAFAALRNGVPVLDIRAQPQDLGRRANAFVERFDNNLLGQYKRAQFMVDGVLVYLQFFRATDDGTMTVCVDLATCVEKAIPPLELALRVLQALGLESAPRRWVHTPSEQLFWQQVDPFLVARKV